MKNAYEFKVEYGQDGKCLRREWAVGPIAIGGVVTLFALFTGRAFVMVPSSFWQLFKSH